MILFSGKVQIYDQDTQADVFLPKGMYAPAELLERIRLLLVRKRGPKRVTRVDTQTGTGRASGYRITPEAMVSLSQHCQKRQLWSDASLHGRSFPP